MESGLDYGWNERVESFPTHFERGPYSLHEWAAAGFYFENERVVCKNCKLEVDDFSADPYDFHRSATCIMNSLVHPTLWERRQYANLSACVQGDECELPKVLHESGVVMRSTTNYNFEKRLETFAFWPEQCAQDKNEMAQSGFVYTGISDIVFCIFCKICLQKWESEDSPWAEHCKYSPKCTHVRFHLTPTEIKAFRNQASESRKVHLDYPDMEHIFDEVKVAPIVCKQMRNERDSATNTLDEDHLPAATAQTHGLTCVVCMENPINILLLPCKHASMCDDCASQIKECPLCRGYAPMSCKIFIAG